MTRHDEQWCRQIECTCCQYTREVPEGYEVGGVPVEPILCVPCRMHVGSLPRNLEARERSHRMMWQEEKKAILAGQEKVVANLEARIEALRQELENRPEKVLTVETDEAELSAARQAKVQSSWFADRMFQVLSLIRAHHRNDTQNADHCMCGSFQRACQTRKDIEEFAVQLDEWDERQLDLLRKDPDGSRLHPDHPARLDLRWTTTGVDLRQWR